MPKEKEKPSKDEKPKKDEEPAPTTQDETCSDPLDEDCID